LTPERRFKSPVRHLRLPAGSLEARDARSLEAYHGDVSSQVKPSVIEELRLQSFKSFRNSKLHLKDFTLLVGRNGSGKSNALDGLWTLSQLARGDDIRESLDGGREGPAVRGGVAGCAPFGQEEFELGCTVRTGGDRVRLDVRIAVDPDVQVVYERLRLGDTDLLLTEEPYSGSNDIYAKWNNDKRGQNPKEFFRSTRLLTSQIPTRIPKEKETEAGGRIHLAAAQVLAALRSVFVLDPVPHQMRQYVPRRDSQLRRNAANLSAALGSLLQSQTVSDRIRHEFQELIEHEILGISLSTSDLDDVMLTCQQRFGDREYPVPARLLSDGSLRFLAILTALLQAPAREGDPGNSNPEELPVGRTTLVIEELENGLHASQTGHLVGAILDEVQQRSVRALATAHSPAALDALGPDEHQGVVICQRGEHGTSVLHPLVELPGYVEIVAHGGLGRAAMADRLRARPGTGPSASSVLDEVLGERP
jgi:predicted ATPase